MTLDQALAYKARLEASLASTTSVVEFEDRRIERRSHDELKDALEWVNGVIADLTNTTEETTGFTRVRVAVTNKDL